MQFFIKKGIYSPKLQWITLYRNPDDIFAMKRFSEHKHFRDLWHEHCPVVKQLLHLKDTIKCSTLLLNIYFNISTLT